MNTPGLIRTPDQRLRIFISSTIRELADERLAVREAITQLRMAPVMFELGARPHPAINLYRAYLEQSHIFIGIYWQSYGYVAPDMEISGLEDEYLLAGEIPKLIYIKSPAVEREAGLTKLLNRIKKDDKVSYKYFSNADELRQLVENDLALLLTERFEDSELRLGERVDQEEIINNNLPAQITTFIGREAEITAVKNLLERQTVRLLTLTGPGGTGKTRLSLQVATRLSNQYKDGVFFIALAEAHEPALVISKIAESLGVREGGSQSLLEGVKNYLRNKQLLLLLDNFEQILDAAPMVTELLESASQLKILVTSRVLVNLHGEYEYPVPTLQLPKADVSVPAKQLADYEALQMFVDRAKAANPHLVVNDRNALVITDICRRLDGLPLAIELAAARVKMLSPQKLLSMLNNRLRMLTGGGRDLPARQQTLRNTLEWSLQLLNPQDQALFARLGVFMGGFSLESAQEICLLESDQELNIFQGIESLLNNSLVQLEYLDTPEPRFKMLETIREFASEKLAERGELETLQHRHAQYFINKMYEVQPLFSTREADRGLAWLDREHDNLRAALACCFRDDSLITLAPWLMMAMNWPWYRRGFLSEGRDWANRLLHASIAQERTLIRCCALWCSGAMAMWQGDLNHALSMFEEGIAIAKSLEESTMVAVTLLFLGTTQVNRGEDKIALKYLQEAQELYDQLAIPWYQAITLVHMGNANLGMGDIDKARACLNQAHLISQQIGENWLISFILNNYGEVARTEGDYHKAEGYYEQSEGLLRAMGDKGDLARLVHNLGCVARHTGNLVEAEDRFKESLGMFIKLGNQRGMAECLASLAGLWAEQGQVQRAAKMLGAAHTLLNETGATWWPADRIEVERNLKDIQQRMVQAQFDTTWEAGSKMNLADALTYANEGES